MPDPFHGELVRTLAPRKSRVLPSARFQSDFARPEGEAEMCGQSRPCISGGTLPAGDKVPQGYHVKSEVSLSSAGPIPGCLDRVWASGR